MIFTNSELQVLNASAIRHAVAFNNGHIIVRQWGDGKPVVLLHGNTGQKIFPL
jgi:hypothetical protein